MQNIKTIDIPFNYYQKENQFKLYFADTGLLLPSYGKVIQDLQLSGNPSFYKGAICENEVCTLLTKKGTNPSSL